MPSIPIQNITDLAAGSVTGNETVPVVQQLGGSYYTYKTPIKNFFYNNAIPFTALSGCTLKWTRNGALSATSSLIVDGSIGINAGSLGTTVNTEVQLCKLTTSNANSSNLIVSTKRNAAGADWTTASTRIIQRTDVTDQGYIEFNPASVPHGLALGSLTNQAIVIDSAGKVGIGKNNPSTALDVGGSIKLSTNNNYLGFTDASGTFPRFTMQSDNNFVFYGTNSTGGDRTIYSIFQRNDTSGFNFTVPVGMASTLQLTRGQSLRWGANGESTDDANITVTQDAVDSTKMRFRIGDNSDINDAFVFERGNGTGGDGSDLVTIQSDGKLGIGVSSPNVTAPLHILTSSAGAEPNTNGVFVLNNGTTSTCDATLAVQVNGANSGDPKVSWDIGGVIGWSAGIDNSDSDKFKIANNWNDLATKTRMVIGSTGHTSFLVDGKGEAEVAKPTTWGGGISTWDIYATGSVGSGPPGGSPLAYMSNTGVVAGITFNSTSSVRFKKDIEPLKDSLVNIQKLRGVRYNWKESGKADIGLIAEEVNEVYPEIVKKDDDGTPEGIDYGKLTAVLIETVKELTQKIQVLERKIQ